MKPYSTSISINANQEAIWKVLSDVAHWHEWTPTVTKVEILDEPELKLNNRYKVFQLKLQPAVWTVTALAAPVSFVWESSAPGMHMIAEHTVHAVSADKSNVMLTFAFHGFLGEIIGRLYGKIVESYIATEAQSLKKSIENRFSTSLSEKELELNFADGQIFKVAWNELVKVAIQTTNEGPFQSDVFWLLDTKENSLRIPQEIQGGEEFLHHLQKLPNFDNKLFISAMGSTENNLFVCWEKKEE